MKRAVLVILCVGLIVSLAACTGNDDVILGDLNLGVLEYEGIGIMGVTYDFYDNGYALIESILHEYAQLEENVSYNGTNYIVVGFVQPSSLLSSTGVFGVRETKSPENLVLPDTIQHISNHALAYCTANTITLPSNLKTIDNGVFSGASNIETISIPETVTSIFAHYLFQNCVNLKSVNFPSNCDILFLDNTFEGCTSLETVTIPACVDYIGSLCFYQCYSLTNVTIENGVERIKENAFMSCPKLTKLVVPESITLIEDGAFCDCTGLTDITLPDNLTDISAKLFTNKYYQPADVSGMTIRVRADMVSYVQKIYPTANVVPK